MVSQASVWQRVAETGISVALFVFFAYALPGSTTRVPRLVGKQCVYLGESKRIFGKTCQQLREGPVSQYVV